MASRVDPHVLAHGRRLAGEVSPYVSWEITLAGRPQRSLPLQHGDGPRRLQIPQAVQRQGFRDSDFHMPMLILAGNTWLLVSDPRRLQNMFRHWKAVLKHLAWNVTTTECTWCHTSDFGDMQVTDSDGAMVANADKNEGF